MKGSSGRRRNGVRRRHPWTGWLRRKPNCESVLASATTAVAPCGKGFDLASSLRCLVRCRLRRRLAAAVAGYGCGCGCGGARVGGGFSPRPSRVVCCFCGGISCGVDYAEAATSVCCDICPTTAVAAAALAGIGRRCRLLLATSAGETSACDPNYPHSAHLETVTPAASFPSYLDLYFMTCRFGLCCLIGNYSVR